jgi:hypothetical protein
MVEGGTSRASALKMAYAAWTKGSAALLLAVRALAAIRTTVAFKLFGSLDRPHSPS